MIRVFDIETIDVSHPNCISERVGPFEFRTCYPNIILLPDIRYSDNIVGFFRQLAEYMIDGKVSPRTVAAVVSLLGETLSGSVSTDPCRGGHEDYVVANKAVFYRIASIYSYSSRHRGWYMGDDENKSIGILQVDDKYFLATRYYGHSYDFSTSSDYISFRILPITDNAKELKVKRVRIRVYCGPDGYSSESAYEEIIRFPDKWFMDCDECFDLGITREDKCIKIAKKIEKKAGIDMSDIIDMIYRGAFGEALDALSMITPDKKVLPLYEKLYSCIISIIEFYS